MSVSPSRARGLGRGLQSLIPLPTDGTAPAQMVAIDQVQPSREQMRRRFPADSTRELAESIRAHGVLQPILVRRTPDGYQLIAGERRLRAAKQAGLERIPAIVREAVRDEDSLLLGLVENLQREDLDPIEEARGIQRLIEQFGLTQEEAAARLGKNRVAVTQALRLLQGCPALVSATAAGAITAGHARALVGLPTREAQERGLRVVLARQLSVRQTERWVRTYRAPTSTRSVRRRPLASAWELEERVRESLGAPVRITGAARGRISIEYSSREQLEAIVAKLTA